MFIANITTDNITVLSLEWVRKFWVAFTNQTGGHIVSQDNNFDGMLSYFKAKTIFILFT